MHKSALGIYVFGKFEKKQFFPYSAARFFFYKGLQKK